MNVSSLMNSAANQTSSSQQSRQAEQPPAPEAKQATPDNDETFIDKAYRSLVLNRMGVDTEQLEEIEQKIEELESKSSLTKDEKDKLESLMKARDQLFEEAMRRQAKEPSPTLPNCRLTENPLTEQCTAQSSITQFISCIHGPKLRKEPTARP